MTRVVFMIVRKLLTRLVAVEWPQHGGHELCNVTTSELSPKKVSFWTITNRKRLPHVKMESLWCCSLFCKYLFQFGMTIPRMPGTWSPTRWLLDYTWLAECIHILNNMGIFHFKPSGLVNILWSWSTLLLPFTFFPSIFFFPSLPHWCLN